MSRPSPPRNDRFEDYVPVAERLEKFYERFPDGRMITQIIEHDRESGFVLIRAEAYRNPDDAQPAATGHAFEVRGDSYVNKSSYVENCETGACGRALALLGFEVKRGIASREEMEKTARMQPDKAARAATTNRTPAPSNAPPATSVPPTSAPVPATVAAPTAQTAPAPRAASVSSPTTTAVVSGAPPASNSAPAISGVGAGVESSLSLDGEILLSAGALGYDAEKVRKWINQKYKVTGGLDSLSADDKREVLRVFREKAAPSAAKGGA